MISLFPTQRLQMLVIQTIGQRNHFIIKPVIAGLVPTDQQNGATTGIESKHGSQWPTLMLSAQFLHIGMLRPF